MSSIRRETALKFIGGFEHLSTEGLVDTRSESCIHTFAPASCSPPPDLSNAAFADHLTHLRHILKAFPVTPTDVMEDAEQNRVIILATSRTVFHEHVMDQGLAEEEWTYRGEYVFFLTMDESGRKIVKIVEFLDSKGTDKLRGLMARARVNLEKKERGVNA